MSSSSATSSANSAASSSSTASLTSTSSVDSSAKANPISDKPSNEQLGRKTVSRPDLIIADTPHTVVDYHADIITGISHTSGTMSYESIQLANGRADRKITKLAIHCAKQPPRPQCMAKSVGFVRKANITRPLLIDAETFDALKESRKSRTENMRVQSFEVTEMSTLGNTVDKWMTAIFNEKKMRRKGEAVPENVHEMIIEVPKSDNTKVYASQKVMERDEFDKYADMFGLKDTHDVFSTISRYIDKPEV